MIFFLILDDNSKLMGIFNLIRCRNYVPAKFLPPLPNCTNFIKCYEYPYSRSPISRKIKSFKFDNFLPFVFSFLPASLPFLVVKGIYLVTLDLSSISISIPRLRRSWIVEVTIDRAILMSKLALNRVWKNSLSLSPQEGMKRSSWRGDFRRFCSLRGILFFTPLIGWEFFGIIQFRGRFVEIYVLRVTCLMYE